MSKFVMKPEDFEVVYRQKEEEKIEKLSDETLDNICAGTGDQMVRNTEEIINNLRRN